MKERELGKKLLEQSNKVLDAKEGKISMDDLCSEFNHCEEVLVEDFKNRMLGRKPEEVKTKTEVKPEVKPGSFLGTKSLR